MPEPAPRPHHFTARAERKPSVLSRVVELFVLRDLIPTRVACDADANGIRLEVVVDGLDEVQANHVAQHIRQFPTVESLLLARDG